MTLHSNWTEGGLRGSGFGLIFAESIGTSELPFDLISRDLATVTFNNQLFYNYVVPAMSEVPYAGPSDLAERTFTYDGVLPYGEMYLSLYDFSGPLRAFSPSRFSALHFSLYDDSAPPVDEQWCIRDVAFMDSCGLVSVRAAGDGNSLPDPPPIPTVPPPTTTPPGPSTTDLTTDAPSTDFVTEETNTNQESSSEMPSSPDAGPTPEPDGEPAFELL